MLSAPTGITPRVDASETDAIRQALDGIGHGVVEKVFETGWLNELFESSNITFNKLNREYELDGENWSDQKINQHLGAFIGFGQIADATQTSVSTLESDFFNNIHKSKIPEILSALLDSDPCVLRDGCFIRSVDPTYPLRLSGLHHDGQLGLASREGFVNDREISMWVPLCNLETENAPRLLLFKRGKHLNDFFESDVAKEIMAPLGYNPCLLRGHLDRNESTEHVISIKSVVERLLGAAYRILGGDVYAPKIKLGSAIFFDKDVWHGSYFHSNMKSKRLSLDFRACGLFRRTPENQHFSGRLFRNGMSIELSDLPSNGLLKLCNQTKGVGVPHSVTLPATRTSGRLYWEVVIPNLQHGIENLGDTAVLGVATPSLDQNALLSKDKESWGMSLAEIAEEDFASNDNTDEKRSFSGDTVFNFAYDSGEGRLWVGIDGKWIRNGNPSNGHEPTVSGFMDLMLPAISSVHGGMGTAEIHLRYADYMCNIPHKWEGLPAEYCPISV